MVIEANIKAQHLCGMSAFLCPTSHTYYPTAFKLTDLPNRCANRPGCGGYHQRFSRFRLTDIQQAHISGKPRHTHNTQRPGGMFGMSAKLHQSVTVGDVIVLPTAVAQYPFAWLVVRMAG
ncbi:hypothetical protein SDC9_191336 [bioreactor metagenome]|uniref:Uncharacterized protein n=1 Tax=bioreactor metagenome TaxID=1076179 RepID=A0A645HYW2_9ZZZZ